MGNIKTPLKGITTTSTYEEGSMYSLVNLRPMNGSLHPVAPRKKMQELSQKYDIVFVHQNSGYKNWIGVIHEDNNSSIYANILDEPSAIAINIKGPVHAVEQVGNTLSFITRNNIFYAWYTNNKYIYLDEIPQIPPIKFGLLNTETSAESYFANEYESGTIKPDSFLEATKGLTNKAMEILMNGGTVNNEPFEGYGLQLFDACFVRYAFRLFDGTLTKHSPPILIMPKRDILEMKTIDYEFTGGSLTNQSKVKVHGFNISMEYNFSLGGDYERWKDIIKSVEIFMSQPIGVSNIENIRKDMPTSTPTAKHFNLIKEISPEVLKNAENTSTFYLVRSIDLGEASDYDILPSKKSDFSKMENLIFQEVMSDDNFSNNKYGAGCSYAYNNRLHLADIKTTFFNGFNTAYFSWGKEYNGVESPEGRNVNSMVVEVDIYTGTALEKVYSFHSEYFLMSNLFLNAFISYPDPRAKRMTIYQIEGDVWKKVLSVPLETHNLLNLAYYMNDGLKPIVGIDPTPIPEPDTSRTITNTEPNKIKVSELGNPLNFRNLNTYQAGNGTIIAMASNAIRISEGQFGQFPLYIFTTQGIYSLNVGDGEVVYSNISAPTSYEIPTTKIVASTPFGVVFTSARGVCIIRGQEVEVLTTALHEKPKELNVEFLPPMQDKIHNYTKPLNQYLREIDSLVYDPYENELIICDKKSKFNYILNLYSQSFYQSTERLDLVVGNTYPQLYVIGDNILKDFESADMDTEGNPTRIDVSFITRPLQFGMPYIKWLEKVQLFCTMYDTDPLVYVSHSSSNGINFKAMSGMAPSKRANYTTLETPRIAGNKFRDFLFCFGATLEPKSVIDYLYSWIGAEYKDGLMK